LIHLSKEFNSLGEILQEKTIWEALASGASFRLQHRSTATLNNVPPGTRATTRSGTATCSPSMGTPLLQQTTPIDNGVPVDEVRKLP